LEGNTYPARWKKQGEKYLVYLDSDKSIRGIDIDFETACEELCLAICDRYADGEAVLNLLREPPQPNGVSKYANPALVALSWNESAEGELWQEDLFEGGYCKACRAGIGHRTSTSLEVDIIPKGEIGSFNQIMFSPVLLSENFLTYFTKTEKDQMGLQPVICRKEESRKFFEVNGEPILKQVGVKAGNYNSLISWECESCGQKSFSCSHPEMPDNYKYTDFVCSSDLPNNTNQAFVIEDNIGRKMICMSLKRWRQLNNQKYSKGVSAERVYVLPEEQIDRNPTVRIEAHAN
jgi:hypothetical protein